MNVKMLRSTDAISVTPQQSAHTMRNRDLMVRTRSSLREPRLWLGIFFLVASVGITHILLNRSAAQVSAVVVTHDLAPGSIVNAQDVVLDAVSEANSGHYVSSLDQVIGHVVSQELYAGDVLRQQDVAVSGADSVRNVAVLIRAGHLPQLTHGSLVDVWVTPSLEGMSAPGPATLALEKVVVDSAPEVVDATVDSAVTLSVNRQQVQQLVQAMRDGLIDLVVVPGGVQ